MEGLVWLEQVFEKYGYLVLLIGLPVDFIALPLPPGQTTLAYTGYLASEGVLSLAAAYTAALIGSCIGVTATYGIGYQAGARLLDRLGRRLLLKPELLEKVRRRYERHGNRFLFFSFFIPGVRQFAGYAVGMLRIPYRTFALYAYGGAACWTAAFIGIGYGFGEHWEAVFLLTKRYIAYICVFAGSALALYAAFRLFRWRRRA